MKIYDYSSIEKLYVVGDIHGEFNELMYIIKRRTSVQDELFKYQPHPLEVEEREKEEKSHDDDEGMTTINLNLSSSLRPLSDKLSALNTKKKVIDDFDDSVIIVCGDCGFGFCKPKYYEELLAKMNTTLGKTNTRIIFLRGNHDDPSYFDGVKVDLEYVKAVPDYSVIKTKNFNTLCVGGAVSVDRTWRISQEVLINRYRIGYKKRLYWPDELFVLDERQVNEVLSSGIKINSLATHSAPDYAKPLVGDCTYTWNKVDKQLSADIKAERKGLTKLGDMLINGGCKLEFWAYGHYHITQWSMTKRKRRQFVLLANGDEITIKDVALEIKWAKEDSNSLDRYLKQIKTGDCLKIDVDDEPIDDVNDQLEVTEDVTDNAEEINEIVNEVRELAPF